MQRRVGTGRLVVWSPKGREGPLRYYYTSNSARREESRSYVTTTWPVHLISTFISRVQRCTLHTSINFLDPHPSNLRIYMSTSAQRNYSTPMLSQHIIPPCILAPTLYFRAQRNKILLLLFSLRGPAPRILTADLIHRQRGSVHRQFMTAAKNEKNQNDLTRTRFELVPFRTG